jgi:hypothetical protein
MENQMTMKPRDLFVAGYTIAMHDQVQEIVSVLDEESKTTFLKAMMRSADNQWKQYLEGVAKVRSLRSGQATSSPNNKKDN